WLVCFLKRAQLIRHPGYLARFASPPDSVSLAGFQELHRRIRRIMTAPCRPGRGQILVVAVGGGAFFFLRLGPFFYTFHSTYLDLLLQALGSILAAGLVWTTIDFLGISYQLRRLLRRLAFHQLASAFERLRRKCSRGLSTNLLDSAPSVAELQETFDQLVAVR